jgi:hypothetical protein
MCAPARTGENFSEIFSTTDLAFAQLLITNNEKPDSNPSKPNAHSRFRRVFNLKNENYATLKTCSLTTLYPAFPLFLCASALSGLFLFLLNCWEAEMLRCSICSSSGVFLLQQRQHAFLPSSSYLACLATWRFIAFAETLKRFSLQLLRHNRVGNIATRENKAIVDEIPAMPQVKTLRRFVGNRGRKQELFAGLRFDDSIVQERAKFLVTIRR